MSRVQGKKQPILYGRPFVSKLRHDIRAVFSHVYLQSFQLHDIRAFFLPHILALFPALWGFYSHVYDHFLTNAHICAHKKAHIYALQTSMWSYKIEAPNYTVSKKTPHVRWSWKVTSAWSMAAMAALNSSKVWFLFIALTVVVVVVSPTGDLLESVDCLLRNCVCYFTNADRNNDRFSYKISVRQAKHDS